MIAAETLQRLQPARDLLSIASNFGNRKHVKTASEPFALHSPVTFFVNRSPTARIESGRFPRKSAPGWTRTCDPWLRSGLRDVIATHHVSGVNSIPFLVRLSEGMTGGCNPRSSES
jgi:hypothetical protein